MTVQLHKQYRRTRNRRPLVRYHTPPLPLPPPPLPRINIILIQKEQKLSDILRTGDIILYKSESIHQNVRFHLKTATRILLIQHYK